MANNSVVIDLLLQDAKFKLSIERATDSAKDLRKELDKSSSPVDVLRKGFDGLKGGLGTVVDSVFSLKGALVAAAGVFSFKKIIDSAIEAEKAVAGAANSLRLSGEYSADALAEVDAFAKSLFDVKGVGDDTALSMFALAQSFGLSKDEAKKVVNVAADLAAATGQDLTTAVNGLSAAYNGNIGKLAKLNPALKELTKAQLDAGLATEILGAQFDGSAAAALETFGGALGVTQERFGDLLEEIGFVITKNEAVIGVVKLAGDAFKILGDAVNNNKDGIKKFITDAIKGLLTTLSAVVKSIEILGKSFKGLEHLSLKPFFDGLAKVVGTVTDEILLLARGFTELKLLLKDPIAVFKADNLDQLKKTNPELATMVNTLQEIDKRRENLAQGIAETIGDLPRINVADSFSDSIDTLIDKLDTMPDNFEKAFDIGPAIKKIDLSSINGTVKGNGRDFGPSKTLKRDDFGPQQSDSEAFDEAINGFANRFVTSMNTALETVVGSLFQNVLGGKEGARKFLGAAAGAAVDAFVPGLGAATAPFIEALSQGKEAVKAQVEAFAEALPELIDAIVEAIPVFIQVLADHAPEIITALAKGAPQVAAAIAIALANPQLYLGVARELATAAAEGVRYQCEQAGKAISKAGLDFTTSISKAGTDFINFFKKELPKLIPEALAALKEGFGSIGTDIADAFKAGVVDAAQQFINTLVDEIKGALPRYKGPGSGSGGGIAGTGIRPEDALNPGGMVPGTPSVGGDGKVTIGGRSFGLTGDVGSEDSATTAVLLSRIIDLLKQPQTINADVKWDGTKLADMILNLNRRNARLT